MAGALDTLRGQLPELAKDLKLNLQSVLQESALTPAQRWGTAIACAASGGRTPLVDALLEDAQSAGVSLAVAEDALAAASLMAMNNIYYRFRHLVGKPSYSQKPARLRMTRIARVATLKSDFELFCLAVSAVNGCEACIQSHEKTVLEAGLTEDHVQDAVRIGSVAHAVNVALSLPNVVAEALP
jgi:lipoyl-dependent peroxiredoxin subunit D